MYKGKLINPPDQFFTAEQVERLGELKSRWRDVREAGKQLLPSEQAELAALVEAELAGAGLRAEAIAKRKQKQK
ncbi:MAG TPA: hypothetical protein VFZ34_28230 [Blastocatellia bacterium]|nr:hypothetical protein [Blastocatellia bacterium]